MRSSVLVREFRRLRSLRAPRESPPEEPGWRLAPDGRWYPPERSPRVAVSKSNFQPADKPTDSTEGFVLRHRVLVQSCFVVVAIVAAAIVLWVRQTPEALLRTDSFFGAVVEVAFWAAPT